MPTPRWLTSEILSCHIWHHAARLIRRSCGTRRAAATAPTLRTKRVSPHTIRHATAMSLLRSGVDINTIRIWLGHVSLQTTHIYAESDLKMKAQALARCEAPLLHPGKKLTAQKGLMGFLTMI